MKRIKKIIPLVLTFTLIISMSSNVLAATRSNVSMPNGGKWTYTQFDPKEIKKYSNNDFRALEIVDRVVYASPESVKNMQLTLSAGIAKDKMQDGVKLGVQTAASSGITAAKNAIIKKYGATTASKIIPILSSASWAYTIYDVCKSMVEGQQLSRLTTAVNKKTGIIYKYASSSGGSRFGWYYWDGSSTYGKYPNAYVGPNTYQLGEVTKN